MPAPKKSEQARMVEWSTDHPANSEDYDYEVTPFGLLLGTPDEWFDSVTSYEEEYENVRNTA